MTETFSLIKVDIPTVMTAYADLLNQRDFQYVALAPICIKPGVSQADIAKQHQLIDGLRDRINEIKMVLRHQYIEITDAVLMDYINEMPEMNYIFHGKLASTESYVMSVHNLLPLYYKNQTDDLPMSLNDSSIYMTHSSFQTLFEIATADFPKHMTETDIANVIQFISGGKSNEGLASAHDSV